MAVSSEHTRVCFINAFTKESSNPIVLHNFRTAPRPPVLEIVYNARCGASILTRRHAITGNIVQPTSVLTKASV